MNRHRPRSAYRVIVFADCIMGGKPRKRTSLVVREEMRHRLARLTLYGKRNPRPSSIATTI
jgi:hypothetical protein